MRAASTETSESTWRKLMSACTKVKVSTRLVMVNSVVWMRMAKSVLESLGAMRGRRRTRRGRSTTRATRIETDRASVTGSASE